MQPLPGDLQPQIQETHRTAHTDTTTRCRTQRRNRSRPERPQPQPPHRRGTFHRRLQPLWLPPQRIAHATCMQPLQCDLQPRIQETNRTTHADTTTHCRTQRWNRSRSERPQPQLPHRQGTFHRRLEPLYTEKHAVSCSSFLPNTSPMQHSCNIPFLPLPFVTTLYEGQSFGDVFVCNVKSHTTLHQNKFLSDVYIYILLCNVNLTPPFIMVNSLWCIVM